MGMHNYLQSSSDKFLDVAKEIYDQLKKNFEGA